jgi:hypothetical protein
MLISVKDKHCYNRDQTDRYRTIRQAWIDCDGERTSVSTNIPAPRRQFEPDHKQTKNNRGGESKSD